MLMVAKPKTSGPKHRHTKNYVKVYWPYMPLLIIVSLGLYLGLGFNKFSPSGVLPYATNVSSSGLLESTNKQRKNNSKQTLKSNKQLSNAAQDKAEDMAKRNYWSHNTPEGDSPWVFITSSGYLYEKVGENLAYGFATSADVVSGWMNSPGHKANLLDPSYTDVGFGFADAKSFQDSGESTIVVAMYGQPQSDDDSQPEQSSSIVSAETIAFNNQAVLNSQPTSEKVSRIEAMTNGSLPWIQIAVGILIGILSTILVVKHGIRIKRALRDGEDFVIHHPLLDITVIALVVLLIILSQQAGIIL
jgi:hypothetical protein